tara:strand:+ start:2969 stop:3361 length:393 start_codon:yes stop_codon:yes gene_type:complete
MEKKIINDKSKMLVGKESTMHHVRIDPNTDEYMKVWIKEPTFLQLEQAQMKLFNINMDAKDVAFDMKEVYVFLWDAFVDRTEPQLGPLDLMRLNPYVGSQIKEILPDPFSMVEVDDDLKVKSELLLEQEE